MSAIATRRERVILELQDDFSTGMAKAAAATALLDNRLDDLDGTNARTRRSATDAAQAINQFDRNAKRSGDSINQLTGRLRLYVDALAGIGPAAVPIAGAVVPALAGMATQLGLVVAAGGVAVATFAGMGDALTALNEAQLDPTEDNLAALRLEMEKLGPAGAEFVRFLDGIAPQLKALQMTAREGALPGFQEGIESLLTMGPQVNRIVGEIAETMGDLAAQSGEALAGPQFAAFFDMLDRRAAPLLREFFDTLGNVAEGIANLFVGFEPLTSQFSRGLLAMTEDFVAWSRTLSTDDGFQSFVSYLQQTGPQVVDLLGSIVQAIAGLVQAAAPLGQALLPALTAIADAFAAIAASPIGPPLLTAAAALALVNRTAMLASATMGSLALSTDRAKSSLTGLTPAANLTAMLVGIGAIDAAFKGLRGSIEEADLARNIAALSNGEAIGGLENLGKKLANVNSTLINVGDKFSDVFTLGIDTSELEFSQQQIEKVDQALASLVESGNADRAAAAFAQIERMAAEAGVSASDTRQQFDAYGTALDNLAAASQGNVFSDFISSLYEVGDAATEEALALERSRQATLNKKNATIAAFDAETQYRQALVAARDAAKANEAGIRGNSEAALANRGALSGLASAWNNQSDAVRTNTSRQREARRAFIAAAEGMGVGSDKARQLARSMLDIPKQVKPQVDVNTQRAVAAITDVTRDLFGLDKTKADPNVTADASSALSAIQNVGAALSGIDGRTATTYVRTITSEVTNVIRNVFPGFGSAEGNLVESYANGDVRDRHVAEMARGGAWRVWAEPETGGESYIPHANDHRRPRARQILEETAGILGGEVEWFARGGRRGRGEAGPSYSLAQRLEILGLQSSIIDLTKQLRASGKKNRLRGIDRRIAEVELRQTQRELRAARRAPLRERRAGLREQLGGLRGAVGEFDIEAGMDTDAVRDELDRFRTAIRESGGEWTKRMGRMGDRLLDVSGRLDRERVARDALVEGLGEQQRALDELTSTMDQYASSVAGNFLTDGFNGARAASGGYSGPAPTLDPAALAARDQVDAMRRDLAGLRGWDDGSIGTAARASRLLAGIDTLEGEFGDEWEAFDRAKEAMAEAAATFEPAVTGLEALAQVLEEDTKRALDMAAALSTLASKGLDTTGPLGGLYASLAASGDLGTAQELAGQSAGEIAVFEQAFAQREAAAAAVAAQATQAVYGEQQAILEASLAAQTAVLERQDARIAAQTATIERLAAREETAVERQTSRVVREVDQLGGEIRGLSRQIKAGTRKGRG